MQLSRYRYRFSGSLSFTNQALAKPQPFSQPQPISFAATDEARCAQLDAQRDVRASARDL